MPLLATLLLLVAAPAHPAPAADGIDEVADALRSGPVYVDPRAADRLPADQADALTRQIEAADKPLFVAVLPANDQFPPQTLLRDLRTQTGIAGVYAVVLGDGFDAGADRSVMSRQAVSNLTDAVERQHGDGADSTPALLENFADQALRQADGSAPDSWSSSAGDEGGGPGAAALLVSLGVVAALAIGGGLLISRRSRRARAERDRAALARLRPVVEEDITAFGEELQRIDFDPVAEDADDAMREDYRRALDFYEQAKAVSESAQRPDEVRRVTESLEEGRFALTVLEARRAGRELPERRPPCFFDPRHGPSVADVPWTPDGGTERMVPVCAADETRLAEGEEPLARTVQTPSGRRPYWEAGPVYAPWAGGYFGGALLPGLLMGTMLGSMLGGGYAHAAEPGAGAAGGGPEGGDYTGGDFSPGDFGGGFDGGGFGGGFDGGGFGGF